VRPLLRATPPFGSGTLFRIASNTRAVVSPSNGDRPVAISNSTTPNEASRDSALVALLSKVRGLAAQPDSQGQETLMLPTFRVEFDAGKDPAAYR